MSKKPQNVGRIATEIIEMQARLALFENRDIDAEAAKNTPTPARAKEQLSNIHSDILGAFPEGVNDEKQALLRV